MQPEDKYSLIPEQQQEMIIQKKIALASLEFLKEKYGESRLQNEHLDNLFARLQLDLNFLNRELEETAEVQEKSVKNFQKIYLEMLEAQRERLGEMNRLSEFDEELIRKYLLLIDVEEYKIREKQLPDAGLE